MGISIHDYLVQIRMPMFFFISGFVLFKIGVVWNIKHITQFFLKKIPIQLIFPSIFFLAYLHSRNIPILYGVSIPNGYWFTYVLFEYYVFYAIIMFCIRNNKSNIVLLILGFFLFFINYRPLYNAIPLSEGFKVFFKVSRWNYFIFFVIGTISKKYFQQMESFLDSKWTLPICISFYFLVNSFRNIIYLPDTILSLPLTITGLIILFSFFRINKSSFSKNHVIGVTLQYIGRRTLDIYLIHFFLIPDNLKFITVFINHPIPIIEATCSLFISILIIAGSLLISNIIRLSPFLAHWVFGAKYPTNKP